MNQVTAQRDAARTALRGLQWRRAALLFTEAADAIPADPHGNVTADETSLRRDAYLALCRTVELQAYRERARKLGIKDFRDEWESPSRHMVSRLLGARLRSEGALQ
jgi:hypothetical protein